MYRTQTMAAFYLCTFTLPNYVILSCQTHALVHKAESQVLGISQALFGRPALWGHPWEAVDPLFVALPIAAVLTWIVSLYTKPMEAKHLNECFNGMSMKTAIRKA
ncbi:MAG TPA: hypothetical protein VLH40_03475 [Atribacteraceae bacterium]|nr:hypothetical protein [Atribacteraceae bacterium]